MSVEDRLTEIERRLAALEGQAAPARPTPRADQAAAPPPRQEAATAWISPNLRPPPPPPPREEFLFSEKWLGQRGLLAVGVLLVLLAAGYLLKLAFDRGWISPAIRCVGGVTAGLVTLVPGARTLKRGLRTYGAALIGLGFGIIYLSLWAASSLYQLVPPTLDMVALTFVSLALAVVAYVVDIEALCVAAAAGAFFAPILISTQRNPDGFLIYLALIGATLGGAAASKQWRYATFIVAVAVFGLGTAAAGDALVSPSRVLLFALVSGSAGLYVGLREGWPETRFLSFAGGWALLAYADRIQTPWLIAAGGVVLAAPIWSRALRYTTIWPDPDGEDPGFGGWSPGETLYFYLTPVLLAWAAGHLSPAWFRGHPGAAPLLVGIAYAIPGLTSPRLPFALVGAAAWAVAALVHWSGVDAAWALLVMALSWAALDHALDRTDGRWYALALTAIAVAHVSLIDLDLRLVGPAFVDTWAVSLWLCIGTIVTLAAGAWRVEGTAREPGTQESAPAQSAGPGFRTDWASARHSWPPRVPAILWTAAGFLLFLGVTGELLRYFRQTSLPRVTAQLAGGLSVSAWWTLFAGGLVGLGFLRDWKRVRVAGLAVAGLAVAKVLLSDLSTLDALYRVASVFILGIVSLVLAYLYHRFEKGKA